MIPRTLITAAVLFILRVFEFLPVRSRRLPLGELCCIQSCVDSFHREHEHQDRSTEMLHGRSLSVTGTEKCGVQYSVPLRTIEE